MNIFDKIVQLDNEIGAHSHTGLTLQYFKAKNNLQNYFGVIVNQTTKRKEQLSSQLQLYFIIVSIIMILISIGASILISKKITEPLRRLSAYIHDFISRFQPKNDYTPLDDNNEVGRLSRNFYILKQEIEDNIQYFKEKVEERTAEILHQKNEIENQKEEIKLQRDILQRTNHTIEKQKEVLEVQNKNIISSIKYAQRIQDAL
jgi:methyl-accepting chemotaxis protein